MFTGETTAGRQRRHPNGLHRKRIAIAPSAEERTYGSLTLLKVEESRLAPRAYPGNRGEGELEGKSQRTC